MAVTPSIIKGYKICYAPYAASAPEAAATEWVELKNCIRSMPNFFPDPDTIDTSTVDNLTPTSIPGWSAGEPYGFTVAPTEGFLAAHKAMVQDQKDDSKGFFWMKIEMTNRKQRIIGAFTTVEYLPTPEGSAGDLDEITWNVYAAKDMALSDITE